MADRSWAADRRRNPFGPQRSGGPERTSFLERSVREEPRASTDGASTAGKKLGWRRFRTTGPAHRSYATSKGEMATPRGRQRASHRSVRSKTASNSQPERLLRRTIRPRYDPRDGKSAARGNASDGLRGARRKDSDGESGRRACDPTGQERRNFCRRDRRMCCRLKPTRLSRRRLADRAGVCVGAQYEFARYNSRHTCLTAHSRSRRQDMDRSRTYCPTLKWQRYASSRRIPSRRTVWSDDPLLVLLLWRNASGVKYLTSERAAAFPKWQHQNSVIRWGLPVARSKLKRKLFKSAPVRRCTGCQFKGSPPVGQIV